MFSSDKNIETIAGLVEELKKYVTLQAEYTKFSLAGKTVRLLTVLISAVVLSVLVLLSLIFFSLALAGALATLIGWAGSLAIVGGLYFLVFLLFIIFRKSWIERPLVRIIATILLSK